jgi:hypothetical protein
MRFLFQRAGLAIAGAAFLVLTSITVSRFYPLQKASVPRKTVVLPVPDRSGEEKEASNEGREEYFFTMLRDPASNRVPERIREKELAFASGLPLREAVRKDRFGRLTANLAWKEAGPDDVGGRTRALGIDKRNNRIIIAAGVSGGIWRSIDGGQSWSKRTARDINLSISCLTQDPLNPDVWYAGMGEYSGSSARARGGNASYFGSGLFKSSDNGSTWNFIAGDNTSFPVRWSSLFGFTNSIQVSPHDGKLYLAANAQGLHASADGGLSFEPVFATQTNAHRWTEFAFATDGRLAVSLGSGFVEPGQMELSPGIYMRDNVNSTFQSITPADFPANAERTMLAFAPSNPAVLFALVYDGNDQVSLFKFTRSGSVWNAENRTANLPDFGTTASRLNAQGGYNMILAIKPDDENVVLFGLTNLHRSFNGFSTKAPRTNTGRQSAWIGGYRNGASTGFSLYPNHHPDQHALVFDPVNASVLWSGHDGGLSRTSDITASPVLWESMNNGYNVTQFYTVAIPADTSPEIMGGTQDNGTPYFTFDGTLASESQDISSGDGSYAHFGTRFLYVSTQNGNVDQYNIADKDWNQVNPASAAGQFFIHPFSVVPGNDAQMVYPAGKTIWYNKTLDDPDKQAGWLSIELPEAEAPGSYRLAAVKAAASNRIYLAAFRSDAPPKLVVLDISGASPTIAVRSIGAVPNGAFPHDIAVHPENPDELLVVFANYNISGVWHSINAGQTFTEIEGNLMGNSTLPGPSIRAAAIVRTSQTTEYYLGTSTGLYAATELSGMATVWKREGNSVIGTSIVTALAARQSDGRIVAATHGRGMFTGDINVSVDAENSAPVASLALEQNFPNPFNPSTTIAFSVPATSHVTITVFDVNGRKVAELVNRVVAAGRHQQAFNASHLASGTYYYQLVSNGETITRKFALIK